MTINFKNPDIMRKLIRLLIENTPVAYIILDKNYRVHYVNDYYLQLMNLKMEEVLGETCYNFSNGGVPCEKCAVRNAILTGKKVSILRKDVFPDGSARYLKDMVVPLRKDGNNEEYEYLLEVMINRTKERVLIEKTQKIFLQVVDLLVNTLEKKDPYTSTHSRDVGRISTKLAHYIGMSDDEVYNVELAALLHDIGKVYISCEIINKPGRLNMEELRRIRKHPEGTMKLLGKIDSFFSIKEIAANHHERWDGKGYPLGLAGDEIPFGARILAIADTYDAMTSDRSYRKALSHDTALEEIIRNGGTQFDAKLAYAFVRMAREHYPSRESLLEEEISYRCVVDEKDPIERHVQPKNNPDTSNKGDKIDTEKIKEIFADDFFMQKVYENTPVYYLIIDEKFNILSVCDSFVRDVNVSIERLQSMKCFEIHNKNMNCFIVKDGVLACPSVRAFQSGTMQKGTVVECLRDGDEMCFDVFSIPTELNGEDGKPVRCVVGILFDRTEEMKLQLAVERDSRKIVSLLTELNLHIDQDNALGSANRLAVNDPYSY